MRRTATDPGRELLARDPDVRRHVRRSTIAAVPLALLVAAQAYGLAAMVVALAQHGHFSTRAAATFVVAAAARGALAWWLERAGRRAAAAAIGRLRAQVVSDAALLSAASPGALRPGEVTADAVTQLPAIEQYVGRFVAAGPIAGATTVIVLIAVAHTDLLSAALLAPTVPLLGVFMWLVGVEAGRVAERRLASLQLLGAHLLDVLRGLVDLRAHGRAEFQRSQVLAAARAYREQTMATLRSAFVSGLVLELIAMLGTALVAVFGGVRLAQGHAELAAILPALILAPELYAPIRKLGAGYHDAADARAALSRLAAVRAAAEAAPVAGTPGVAPAPRGGTQTVTLEGVSVDGIPGRPMRLHHVNLSLEAGSTTALVGPSGAGKSTLAALLLGLLAPTSGRILSGSTDLAGVDLDAWRAGCAWVPQDPVLIPASLADNVRLSAPNASEDAVRTALADAGLSALVDALPAGLDTTLGEGGAQLSSGELRRLALARALLTDATLLVLDEPTAQLDDLTATRLLQTIDAVRRGRTTILITHDPAAVAHADQVVHLRDGAVAHVEICTAVPSGATVAVASTTTLAERAEPLPAVPLTPPAGRPSLRMALRLVAPERGTGIAQEVRRAIGLGALSATAAVAVLTLSGGLIVEAANRPPVLQLTMVIVLVRMFSIMRAVTRYGERLMSHDAALRILEQVRVRLFAHISHHVPGRWSDRTAEALDHAVGDVERSADLLIRVVVPGASAIVAAAIAVLLAAIVSIPAGLLAGVAILSVGALTARIGLKAGGALAESEPERAALGQQLLTALDASRELRLAGRTDAVAAQIAAQGARLDTAAARHGARTAALGGVVNLGAALGATAMAALTAPLVAANTLGAPYSGPLAAALVLGTLAAIERLEGIADAALATPAATAAAGRLAPALLELEDDGARDADRCAGWLGGRSVLRADHVSLARGGRPVLVDTSLAVEPGEVVALTGESGSGKSTLLLVLAGLLPAGSGSAQLAQTDLARMSDAVRAGRVLLVPSAPHLFGGSLAANLRVAAPHASDAQLHDALTKVGLSDWLASLPQGLATELGEGGATASGGQRQRIGLARAVLAPAAIVLLDEPASHLPEADAIAALRAVIAARPGRGAVLVSHRASERDLARRTVELEPPGCAAHARPVPTQASARA